MGFPHSVLLSIVLIQFTAPSTSEVSQLITSSLSTSCPAEEHSCRMAEGQPNNIKSNEGPDVSGVQMESQAESVTDIEEPMDQERGSQLDAEEMSQEKDTEDKDTQETDHDEMSQGVQDSTANEDSSHRHQEAETQTETEGTGVDEKVVDVLDEKSEHHQLGAQSDIQRDSQTDVPVTEDTQKEDETEQEEVRSKLTAGTEGMESSEEEEEEIPPFSSSLEGFGYKFNKEGQLRSIKGEEGFQFEVKKGNKKYNQAHYEALGEVITDVVYGLLVSEGNLRKVTVPVDCKGNEPSSFFFMSEDALTNPDKLMILIHGSGVVRAGQWARSLIINDCLDSGTQLPYIKRAMKEGYGVMVLNTNLNHVLVDGEKKAIRNNSTPQQHANYVWKHFVKKAKAKRIDIVAHSFGGVVTVDLVADHYADFKSRVHKIAFTDSVHILSTVRLRIQKWIISHTCNWVSSETPLDTKLKSFSEGVKRVSAGTPKHVETSWFAFESVFRFLSSK